MGFQREDFRFTLKTRSDSYVLVDAPIGWEELLLKWMRSASYYGTMRNYTLPLKFVLDGATILRREFYQHGIEADVQLMIEELSNVTWQYKDDPYVGDIDFSSFNDDYTSCEANIMEGGLSKLIKAYENVKYEIPLDVPEVVYAQIQGIKLAEANQFVFLPQMATDFGYVFADTEHYAGLDKTSDDIKADKASTQDVEFATLNSDPLPDSARWFFRANADGNVNISGHVIGNNGIIKIVNQNATTVYTIVNTILSQQPNFDVHFNFNMAITAGTRLYMVLLSDYIRPALYYPLMNIQEGELYASYYTQSAPTFCKMLRPKYIFDKLIEKMAGPGELIPEFYETWDQFKTYNAGDKVFFNGENYQSLYNLSTGKIPNKRYVIYWWTVIPKKYKPRTQSFLLENDWPQLCFTCGDAIRGLAGSKIKISFKEFFDDINAITNAGHGIENGLAVLERKDYFFRPGQTIVNVGEIKDFQLEVATDFIYNSIKVGYADQTYDELNGRDEVNSEQNYSTAITRISKELNLIPTVRADVYGIEFLRVNLDGKATTDSNSDNDTFAIKLSNTVYSDADHAVYYKPESGEKYTSITGIFAADTGYNLDITPKQNLLRHGNFIHGMLDGQEGTDVKFESATKNSELVTTSLSGKIVSEKADLNVATLDPKLFLPYIVTITAKLPINTADLISTNSNGVVKFTYKDNEYAGFILEASQDVSKNSQREFKLLLSPANNLLSLAK